MVRRRQAKGSAPLDAGANKARVMRLGAQARQHGLGGCTLNELISFPSDGEKDARLDSLACKLFLQGEFERARPLLKRALAIHEEALGSEHPKTANILQMLALTFYLESGEYLPDELARAQPLFERALAIREKVLGFEHPATAMSLFCFALTLYPQGNARVQPFLERALASLEKALVSEQHPETLHSLVQTLYLQGDYMRAHSLSVRAEALERALATGETMHLPVAETPLERALATGENPPVAEKPSGGIIESSRRPPEKIEDQPDTGRQAEEFLTYVFSPDDATVKFSLKSIPESERRDFAAEIARMIDERAKAAQRPKWDERGKYAELKDLSSPMFLKQVWADEIATDGTIRKDAVRKVDAKLMGIVEAYISDRERRGLNAGEAEGLRLVASQAGRPKRGCARMRTR